ncbi:hypothetical protein ACHAWF_015923 [Thalassiosira exigua]
MSSDSLCSCINSNYSSWAKRSKTKKGVRSNLALVSSVLGVPRTRRSVTQVYSELGKQYSRRAFRVSYANFVRLYRILKPDLLRIVDPPKVCKHPNGPISLPVRLGAALRFFAGAEAYDICCMFGISHSSVFESIDDVIDAINQCKELKIEFPACHERQREIAAGFRAKSTWARFGRCVGCIDGIIIWTHKPSKEDCDEVGVDEKKFFCGRKSKFGLNMQAVCDDKRRFVHVSINYGAASSDHMAFEVSELKQKLSQPGFLANGLCLFGDNAYVNSKHMATPYPNVGSNTDRDRYNFHHSQLRINIECAFGILTNRFGFLRKIAPKQYTVKKVMAIVMAMCRLHNLLIDFGDTSADATRTECDELHLAMEGAVPVIARGDAVATRDGVTLPRARVPLQLMDAGHHHADDPTRRRRLDERRRSVSRQRRASAGQGSDSEDDNKLPREKMYEEILDKGLRRPPRDGRRR